MTFSSLYLFILLSFIIKDRPICYLSFIRSLKIELFSSEIFIWLSTYSLIRSVMHLPLLYCSLVLGIAT